MGAIARKSISFTSGEITEIEAVLRDDQEQALLGELAGSSALQGTTTHGASFSEVVRALARLGLRELERRRLAALYRASAQEAARLMSPERASSMRRQSLRALDTMLPRADAAGATAQGAIPQE